MKTFVIAGNRQQADQWIKSNLEKRRNEGVTTLSWSDYVVVDKVNRLRGISDPHGVFVGTWKQRTDILEVVQALMTHQIHPSPKLMEIYKSLRPTPKQPKHLNGTWSQSVHDAADDLAKQIDAEVMRSFNGGVMGARQDGYAVAYDSLMPTMIQAIQDLKKELDEVKNGI